MKMGMLLVTALTAGVIWAVQGTAGPYSVDLTTNPAVIPVGKAALIIKVSDQNGRPVTGATVKAIVRMPGMAMGEREETATPGAEPGVYTASAQFGMRGAYEATVSVSGPQGSGQAVIPLETGQDTGASGRGMPWGALTFYGALAAIILLVIIRMRRTGQSLDLRGIFTRQVILSLLLLGGAMAVAIWAVRTLRREGSMTPLEAQGMEMSTPAPEGVLPVRIVKAEIRPFASSVNYAGQAVGYVEQDVTSRVTGSIVAMNVYVGDRVRKGQVLARLDTSQVDPMVSEKLAGVANAEHGVAASVMEYRQALAGITQARAEVTVAQEEFAEAEAMLGAAREGRVSAEADLTAAQAEVEAMQAELDAARAASDYQQQELARSNQLFQGGAISKDEWQRARSEAQKSLAMVTRAQGNLQKAQAAVTAARSALRRADAEIVVASRKVHQAEATVRAKQSAVKSAQAAAEAAKKRVSQARAGVQEAAAATRGVMTQRDYAVLRSEVDGVVTQRLISPGTVVLPGQVLLKVAQISPIRLQANVSEADLARIRVGAEVEVTQRDTQAPPIVAKVTSVSPSVDPTSRTGIVEALFPNPEGRFLPGQYVSMTIVLGREADALVIESAAVQVEGQGAGRTFFVWVAEPSVTGDYTVRRQEVEVSDTSKDLVAIRHGLEAGDQVVIAPPRDLRAGMRVSPVLDKVVTRPSDEAQVVEITNAGYNPPSISVPSGKPFKLTFIRKTDETCGTEIVFPDLGIRAELPLNKPVTISLPAQPAGKQLNFTCPMDMLRGKAVAR
jgi:RND family efflux transporter MFP subunit